MNRYILLPSLFLTCLAMSPLAQADIISLNTFVKNASFEVPVTSCCSFPSYWSQGGTTTGDAGNWDPSSLPAAGLSAFGGTQVGYINNYSLESHAQVNQNSGYGGSPQLDYRYLSQTLFIPGGMRAGNTYILTYGVASRADLQDPAGYRVQINGNYSPDGCSLCDAITSGSTGSFASGTWYLETVRYTARPEDEGFQPTIYLVNDGRISGTGPAQLEFDLPEFALPEPSSVLLLGLQLGAVALLWLVARRKCAPTSH
jgi:hypothetical protein